ncbi:MAG TPA: F0F1 ATP synthase subunit A [Candidatus Omnitrophota bacterium]|nr:F0F1 ATP synthase subunit A [Candidatus Omnitrophota bacterium]
MSIAEQSVAQTGHVTEELPNFITLLNQWFPHSGLVHFFHYWENIVFSFLVLGLIAHRFIGAARQKSFLPKGRQNRCEMVVEGITGFVTGILGPKGIEHVPFLGTLFIYILIENFLGMIPFMKSPTSAWSTTIALALITTVYVQWVGIKEQGFFHYVKHMAGNPQGLLGLALVPIMLVINLSIEYLAVPLSLSLRLFANVSSEDKLLYKFAELTGMYWGAPFPFQIFANVLVMIFSLVQAFVFLLLATVYISLIMPHDEEHSDPQCGASSAAH